MYEETRGNILIISHQERILNIADKIVVIREGKVDRVGSREEILPGPLKRADTGNTVCDLLTLKAMS
jgi:Fe-S cluster assembly ATP-binding protein